MCEKSSRKNYKCSVQELINANKFAEVYAFIKSKIMYLNVAIDNYNLIFASEYENYLTFAQISPAFTNMIWKSMICGIYTNLAELIQKDTVVGVQTLVKIATINCPEDIEIKENSNGIITLIKSNTTVLKDLIRLRNKEICHFDENVLTGDTVSENSKCMNIGFLKQFLYDLETLLSKLRLSYMKDGIYDTMCPINSSDSNNIKDIINTYNKFKKEIKKLKYK